MQECNTIERTKLHEAALKVVSDAVKAGVKIIKGPMLKRKIEKGTINKLSRKKPDKSKSAADARKQLVEALEKHGPLTSNELVDYTGYEKSTLFNAAKILERKKVIIRVKGKKPTDLTVFKLA